MCDDCDCDCVEDVEPRNSSSGGNSAGDCFIATAAYGSYSEPHVLTLREFRDTVLARTVLGILFIRSYYKVSPPIANIIATREYAKKVVRVLLKPIVYLVSKGEKS